MTASAEAASDRWWWLRRLGIAALAAVTLFVVCVPFAMTTGNTKSARVDHAVEQLQALQSAAAGYRQRTGHWPISAAELRGAGLLPSRLFPDEADVTGAYEDYDPWGHPYVFTPKGADLEVRCEGADASDPSDDLTILVAAEPAARSP